MSDESEVFRGDRRNEGVESGARTPPKPKAAPTPPALSKNNLPAAEPVGDWPESAAIAEPAAPVTEFTSVIEPGPVNFETEPEPPYNFEIDPDSLWTMPEAMQERLSNLNSTVAVIHRQLDDQERESARIAKALRALQ